MLTALDTGFVCRASLEFCAESRGRLVEHFLSSRICTETLLKAPRADHKISLTDHTPSTSLMHFVRRFFACLVVVFPEWVAALDTSQEREIFQALPTE